ncbi:MAG: hypothetical protein JOY80_10715 [Candidatus Dormibacteraeota bacterium]|nr:hypothetical protein [Candidatus Dormibacteraeota bacterium]
MHFIWLGTSTGGCAIHALTVVAEQIDQCQPGLESVNIVVHDEPHSAVGDTIQAIRHPAHRVLL